jgi:hypothetical protein
MHVPGRTSASRDDCAAGRPVPALVEERADFLIVGAFALAAHATPRATGDLALWVRPKPSNAERVWWALDRFGVPVEGKRPANYIYRRASRLGKMAP